LRWQVVGNNSALTLAHALVQPFGVISSVGVHQAPPLPFTGRAMYDTNVTLEFGRCPVRALFPLALEVLRARQDVFGSVGVEAGLVERIVPIGEAARWYEEFDKGRCGKVLFDPWA
jgi:threonine dehydrogenase-like Zn-dependent dehydrogenase